VSKDHHNGAMPCVELQSEVVPLINVHDPLDTPRQRLSRHLADKISRSNIQSVSRASEARENVRVILEMFMVLHDAIGFGLFVEIFIIQGSCW